MPLPKQVKAVRLPEDLTKLVQQQAEKEDRTFSDVVRRTLSQKFAPKRKDH